MNSARLKSVPIAFAILAWALDLQRLLSLGAEGAIRWSSTGALVLLSLLTVRSWRPHAIWLPTIAFFSVIMISAVVGSSLDVGIVEFLRLAFCASTLLYAGAIQINAKDSEDLRDTISNTLLLICLLSIISIPLDPKSYIEARLIGVTPHPNVLAFCGAVLAVLPSRNATRFGIHRLFRLAVGAIVTTLAQGQIAQLIVVSAFALQVLEVALEAFKVPSRSARKIASVGAAGILVAFLAIPFFVTQLPSDVANHLFQNDLSSLGRYYAWQSSLGDFTKHPFLGSGFGSRIMIASHIENKYILLRYSHSAPLTYLGSTGIIGLTAFLLLIMSAFRSVQNLFIGQVGHQRSTAGDAFWMLYATILFSSVEAGLQLMPLSWLIFWLSASLGRAPHPNTKE